MKTDSLLAPALKLFPLTSYYVPTSVPVINNGKLEKGKECLFSCGPEIHSTRNPQDEFAEAQLFEERQKCQENKWVRDIYQELEDIREAAELADWQFK